MQSDIKYNQIERQIKRTYHYGPAEQRCVSELCDAQDALQKKILYNGSYELIVTNGNT